LEPVSVLIKKGRLRGLECNNDSGWIKRYAMEIDGIKKGTFKRQNVQHLCPCNGFGNMLQRVRNCQIYYYYYYIIIIIL